MDNLLIDAAEEASSMAEFMRDLYHTFQKCRAGLGDEADWNWLEQCLDLTPPVMVCMPIVESDSNNLPF